MYKKIMPGLQTSGFLQIQISLQCSRKILKQMQTQPDTIWQNVTAETDSPVIMTWAS